MNIEKNMLPSSQYMGAQLKKRIIILHHTAGATVESALETWKKKPERVGTHFIIGRDGRVVQCIPDNNWAYALGLTSFTHKESWESEAIQIELVAMGYLTPASNNQWKSYVGSIIPESEVSHTEYRTYKAYHKYTQAQLQSLKELLIYINQHFHIPLKTGAMNLFFNDMRTQLKNLAPANVTQDKTIFTHTNFRTDKTDCFPQAELLQMLESLSTNAAPIVAPATPKKKT